MYTRLTRLRLRPTRCMWLSPEPPASSERRLRSTMENCEQFLANDSGRSCGSRSPRIGVVPEPEMSLPRSVAEVLADHVSLEVEGIDRMYLNVYVPQLQREVGVASFFRYHRGYQFVSSALIVKVN